MRSETTHSSWQRGLIARVVLSSLAAVTTTASIAAPATVDCDLARKADIMNGPQWQRAVAELGEWLGRQTVYTPAEVQRIKVRFNERVAGMSSLNLPI